MRVILCCLILIISRFSYATEMMLWEGKPLPIDLAIGETRIIDFDDSVKFYPTPSINNNIVEAFSLDGKLYLTAKEAFPIERLSVSFMSDSSEILLDISSSEYSNNLSDVIVRRQQTEDNASSEIQSSSDLPPLASVDLFRFASLDSYAPERLRKTDSRFSAYRVKKEMDLSELFIGQSYGLYESRLIKAWQVNNMYLTVVAVRNLSSIPRQLNLFDLNLDATLAAPQRVNLSPRNVAGETTRFYVITTVPFENALGQTPIILARD